MDRKTLAKQLKENPLLAELMGAWRQEVVDAMLQESDQQRRDALWAEQHYLTRLSETIESELDSIIGGRESGRDGPA